MDKTKIKVVVCDDQKEIVSYLSNLINEQSDLTVVGTAESGKQSVEVVRKLQPDIILMDIQMESELAGIEAIEKIASENNHAKIIVITVHESDELILDAYLAGAVDYVLKTSNEKAICDTIRSVYRDDAYLGPIITHQLRYELKNMRDKQKSLLFVINEIGKLTPTEIDVLRHLYEGKTQNEVAKLKYLEVTTIKFHVKNILKKLQFSSIRELNRQLKEFKIFENDQLSFTKKK